MTEQSKFSKVLFHIPGEGDSVDVETLWAEPLGKDAYRIENSPFYAYSVSWQDIVYAPYSEEEGFATFEKVIEKSGRQTVRVIFEQDTGPENKHLLELVSLGCSFEGASKRYFCIDFPASVKLNEIKQYLIAAELQWEHADPSYRELHPNDV